MIPDEAVEAAMRRVVGDSIRAALDFQGMSQTTLAAATGLTTKHVNQVIRGNAPLSVDVALRFEAAIPDLLSAEDLIVAQAREQVRKAKSASRCAIIKHAS